jgi:hypothetical protein
MKQIRVDIERVQVSYVDEDDPKYAVVVPERSHDNNVVVCLTRRQTRALHEALGTVLRAQGELDE